MRQCNNDGHGKMTLIATRMIGDQMERFECYCSCIFRVPSKEVELSKGSLKKFQLVLSFVPFIQTILKAASPLPMAPLSPFL